MENNGDQHSESSMRDPGLDPAVEPAAEDVMERPVARPEPTERDDVMCVASFASIQEHPPFHHRRGLATIRPRQVDQKGAARLLCDGLHEGPHRWPPAYDPLVAPHEDEDLAGDGGDEGEIVVD